MDTVIRVEDLSKKYIIGHQKQERYVALRDVIVDKIKNFGRKSEFISKEEFWALKDISFEIKQGDRVGIIGRNGAGKSTLLKLLSRIAEPSTGRISIKGRVASLLEVGTGFHPELTGRENIFLNGAILGMSKAEIKKKFDEIVEFAEVEKFLDTPVKRYSSGMYVRLAFAVAAHIEPEILIVDEVLAVGDMQFQKKSMSKMNDVSKEGRTILFVSHNMIAVKQLCNRGILLSKGNLIYQSNAVDTVEKYFLENNVLSKESNIKKMIENLPEDPVLKINSINIHQNEHDVGSVIENGSSFNIEIIYIVKAKVTGLRLYIDICDNDGELLFRSFHDEDNDSIPTMLPGRYKSKVEIPANILGPVRYLIRVTASVYNTRHCFPEGKIEIPIAIEKTGTYNRAYLGDTFRGKLGLKLSWQNTYLD